VHFVIKSCILVAKEKSITLAFGCWVSEAGFNVLMHLLDFWIGGGSCFEVHSWSRFGVAYFSSEVLFFLSPCILVFPVFLVEVFVFS
jgi:hypothetical protein